MQKSALVRGSFSYFEKCDNTSTSGGKMRKFPPEVPGKQEKVQLSRTDLKNRYKIVRKVAQNA